MYVRGYLHGSENGRVVTIGTKPDIIQPFFCRRQMTLILFPLTERLWLFPENLKNKYQSYSPGNSRLFHSRREFEKIPELKKMSRGAI